MIRNKILTLIAVAIAALLATSCGHETQYIITGTLYTDSTTTTPIGHATLRYHMDITNGVAMGTTTTDAQGRFAFSFWNNGADQWESSSVRRKFEPVEYWGVILYAGDTVWAGQAYSHTLINTYPSTQWHRW